MLTNSKPNEKNITKKMQHYVIDTQVNFER